MTNTPILRRKEEMEVEEVEEQEQVVKQTRQPSKALSVKDKNKMCSILGFLLYLKEKGTINEETAKEMMEELPLYSTARVQIEFFEQEVFDLKKVELELWKPMVVENRKNKKTKKTEKKNKKEEEIKEKEEKKEEEPVKKEKKTRAKPVKKEVVEEGGEEVKKRGRKVKKQIVEFNEEVNDDIVANTTNTLDDLLKDMIEKEEEEGEINENDLDDILKEIDNEKQPEKEKEEETEAELLAPPQLELEPELVEEEMVVDKKKKQKVSFPKDPPKKQTKKTTK